MGGNYKKMFLELTKVALAADLGNDFELAVNRYQLKRNTVDDHHEFCEIFTDMFRYCEAHLLHVEKERIDYDWAYSRARELLESAFGQHGGLGTAYNIANTGAEGGLRLILHTIASTMLKKREEHRITTTIDMFVSPLDFQDRVEFAKWYVENYFPDGCGKDPSCLAGELKDLIRYHLSHLNDTQLRGL